MPERRLIFVILLILLLLALALPQLVGALYLNLANTQIDRAVAYPPDAPLRAELLQGADSDLMHARSFANPPRVALAAARIDMARNDAAGALVELSASGDALANDAIAQFAWGNAAWQAGERDSAFAHWRAANALEYFRQQMYRAQDAHLWQQAADWARMAVGINPGFADGYYVLGDALSRLNIDNADALVDLDHARELTQDKELAAACLSRKGEILASQKKLNDAIAVFAQARQVAPIDARPRTGYAIAMLQLDPNARDQSVALLKQVIADSPWYVAAYIALGNLSESSGQANEAQTWLEAGLQRNQNNPSLLFALGQLYARQNRSADSKTSLVLAMRYETHADLLLAISRALASVDQQ